jgi:hypothetical protein
MEILNAALVSSHTHTLLPHLANQFTTSTRYARPRPDRFRGPLVLIAAASANAGELDERSNMLQEMSDVGEKNRSQAKKEITDPVDDRTDDLSGQASTRPR